MMYTIKTLGCSTGTFSAKVMCMSQKICGACLNEAKTSVQRILSDFEALQIYSDIYLLCIGLVVMIQSNEQRMKRVVSLIPQKWE